MVCQPSQTELASNIDFLKTKKKLKLFILIYGNYFSSSLVINLLFLLCESGHFRDSRINVWSKNIHELCSDSHLLVDILGMLQQSLDKRNRISNLTGMTVVGACMCICYWFNKVVVAVGLGPFQLKWVGICHTELNANIEQHHILYNCIILHWNRGEVLLKDWFCKIITSWWSQSMEYWLCCVDMLRDRFTRQDDEASPMQCNAMHTRVDKPT